MYEPVRQPPYLPEHILPHVPSSTPFTPSKQTRVIDVSTMVRPGWEQVQKK